MSIIFLYPSKTYAKNSCYAKITAVRKDNGYEIPSPFTADNIQQINILVQTTTVEKFRVETYYLQPAGFIIVKEGDAVEFNNTNEFGFSIGQVDRFGLYTSPGTYRIKVKVNRGQGWEGYGDDGSCDNITYTVNPAPSPTPVPENCKISIDPVAPITSETKVTISSDQPANITTNDPTNVIKLVFSIRRIEGIKNNQENEWTIEDTKSISKRRWNDGRYKVSFSANYYNDYSSQLGYFCQTEFVVDDKNGGQITPTPTPTIPPIPDYCYENELLEANKVCNGKYSECPWCPKKATSKRPNIDIPDLKPLCDQLTTENNARGKCWECQNKGEIWSAIGCLPTDFSALVNKYVFTTGVGLAGGIAFIYFLYGAFLILTSSGNAEKMEEAKQIITSSLAGLILIIFSVFLLKTIGVDILKLPGGFG